MVDIDKVDFKAMEARYKRFIKAPFRADYLGGYIFTADNLMFAQIRGWGQLQREVDGAECQDAHLKFLVDALNEKAERDAKSLP